MERVRIIEVGGYMGNVIATLTIDPHLDSYEKFFDHKRCEDIFEAARNTPIAVAVDALMLAWRSANGAHILPWLMVTQLKDFARGESKGGLEYRAGYSERVVRGIVEKLLTQMKYSLDFDQRSALKRAVARIEKEAYLATRLAHEQMQFPMDDYWDDMLHKSEFQFCIVGLQGLTYKSLYFAYEDFLSNSIRTVNSSFDSRRTKIRDGLKVAFGVATSDYCWDAEVDMARLVRNSLAHNGGRVGDELSQRYGARLRIVGDQSPELRPECILVVDGRVEITPMNSHYLFDQLRSRVCKIVEHFASSK